MVVERWGKQIWGYIYTEKRSNEEKGVRGLVGRGGDLNLCVYAAGSHISCVQVAFVRVWSLMRGGEFEGVRGDVRTLNESSSG